MTVFTLDGSEESKIAYDMLIYTLLTRRTSFRGKVSMTWNLFQGDDKYAKRVEQLTPLRFLELRL